MAKYRKRPVVIDAEQWNGGDHRTLKQLLVRLGCTESLAVAGITGESVHIRTLEGEMTANSGDWIIKGVEGELYACKDSIFKATYVAA